jgi:hypothetical protein
MLHEVSKMLRLLPDWSKYEWTVTYSLDHGHLVLVGSLPAFGVWTVSVAVLAVVVVLPEKLVGVRLDLGDRCI